MTTALILGASRGIGREFVRQLVAAKWRVSAMLNVIGGLKKEDSGTFRNHAGRTLSW